MFPPVKVFVYTELEVPLLKLLFPPKDSPVLKTGRGNVPPFPVFTSSALDLQVLLRREKQQANCQKRGLECLKCVRVRVKTV